MLARRSARGSVAAPHADPDNAPESRAKDFAKLLIGAGLPRAALVVDWSADVAPPDGDGDRRGRRTAVRVEP